MVAVGAVGVGRGGYTPGASRQGRELDVEVVANLGKLDSSIWGAFMIYWRPHYDLALHADGHTFFSFVCSFELSI